MTCKEIGEVIDVDVVLVKKVIYLWRKQENCPIYIKSWRRAIGHWGKMSQVFDYCGTEKKPDAKKPPSRTKHSEAEKLRRYRDKNRARIRMQRAKKDSPLLSNPFAQLIRATGAVHSASRMKPDE